MFNGTYSGTWAPNFRLVNNGDAADQTTFNTCYQDALDRTGYLKEATAGLGTSPVHMQSYNGTQIELNGQAALTLSSRVVSLPGAGLTFNAADKAGVANLSFNTWYYVYAIYNGGFDILVSAEVPKSNLRYALSSNDEMYLGCFRSDGAGNILPFTMHQGLYLYELNTGNTYLRVLNAGAAVVYTDVSMGTLVPPHVREALLYVVLNNNLANAQALVDLRRKGDAATGNMRFYVPNNTAHDGANPAITTHVPWITTDSAQTIQYAMSNNNANATIFVRGFRE